ncbi:MAG: thiamine biosynthesis protein ThiF [Epsilonproteobacteria bacterium]|nr:MAG: thiamine biosynthesis protein ThiF [Campylobacterota bacterium]
MRPEAYFRRQIELWGSQTQKELQKKKIAIIGSGGLGSTLALALGTSGIGEIHIVDFDRVSFHNIHRQIAFTLKDEGLSKSKVTAALTRSKNPFVKVVAFDMDFATFSKLRNSYDLILDATDNLPVRRDIDLYAKVIKTPWIYASVEEFNGQVCFFEEADFQVFNITDHQPGGIAAPIVMHIGSLQANLALRYLAGLPVVKDKLYYLYFNDEGELITQKFGMPKA